MFETLYHHQTFTNCVLGQKRRDEKKTLVIMYVYVGLAFQFSDKNKNYEFCCNENSIHFFLVYRLWISTLNFLILHE